MRSRLAHICLILPLLLSLATPAHALYEEEALDDPALEARAVALDKRLMCPSCEGQSLHDSEADLARAMRIYIRDKIEAGQSDEEILADMELRYGGTILSDPPRSGPGGIFFWAAPLLFLLLGLGFALSSLDWKTGTGNEEEDKA